MRSCRWVRLRRSVPYTCGPAQGSRALPTIPRESDIKIAIIGAGNVGRTLGTAWSANHQITFGVRDPEDPKHSSLKAGAKVEVADNAAAASASEVVVLCTPWQSAERAVRSCGDLNGTVLIDCTNPLNPDMSALEVGHISSGAELVAQWAPGARVCKAMNQIGAPMMDHPALPATPVMLICGDDDAAKGITADLVTELGFETIDAGDLTLARLLEPYALIWIHLALRRGLGTNWGFGVLRGES
jgi:8-hydroxy-5-deazaflavin:NADPH oxidoreductase